MSSHRPPLSQAFSDVASWDQAFADTSERIDELRRTTDGDFSPEMVVKGLRIARDAARQRERLWTAAQFKRATDQGGDNWQNRHKRARELAVEYRGAARCLHRELLKLGEDVVRKQLAESGESDAFGEYVRDLFRRSEHVLGAGEGEALDELWQTFIGPTDMYWTVLQADFGPVSISKSSDEGESDEDAIEVTNRNLNRLLTRSNREVRRRIHQRFYESFPNGTICQLFLDTVRSNVATADLHNFESTRAYALDHISGISTDIRQNGSPSLHERAVELVEQSIPLRARYDRIQKRALGVDRLRPWDTNVWLTESNTDIPFSTATEYILDALSPLGSAYCDRIEVILSANRDLLESDGAERMAVPAQCYTAPGYQPAVSMQYSGTGSSLFTLIHELGHAVHWSFAADEQQYRCRGSHRALSELPSHLHEYLLLSYLQEREELQPRVTERGIRWLVKSFYYPGALSVFNHDVHAAVRGSEPVGIEDLGDLYCSVTSTFRPELDYDEHFRHRWARTGHFFVLPYNFYPYIIGSAGAVALGRRIEDGTFDPSCYRSFLSSGTSRYVPEQLSQLGFGEQFDSADALERLFDELLDDLSAEVL